MRDVLPNEAETLLQRRFAFFNVWKPIHRRVEELPLGVCDVGSTVGIAVFGTIMTSSLSSNIASYLPAAAAEKLAASGQSIGAG